MTNLEDYWRVIEQKCHLSDANRPYLLQICHPQHDLFHAVHLECAHAALGCGRKQLDDPRSLLNQSLGGVVGNKEFMQTQATFVAGLVAALTPNRTVEIQLPVLTVVPNPAF